jgi:KUP system potassium uptake protein
MGPWHGCSIATYESGSVFRAYNPAEIANYWRSSPENAWRHMSSVFLAVTGCEALYADLGHFNRPAIQLSFFLLVYPALILTYLGQASYILGHIDQAVGNDFYYRSLPKPLLWPMLVLATAASVVASQVCKLWRLYSA